MFFTALCLWERNICMTSKLHPAVPYTRSWRRQHKKPRMNPPSSRPESTTKNIAQSVFLGNYKYEFVMKIRKGKKNDTLGYPWKQRKKGTVLVEAIKVAFDMPSERSQRRSWPNAERLPSHVVESQRRRASVIQA